VKEVLSKVGLPPLTAGLCAFSLTCRATPRAAWHVRRRPSVKAHITEVEGSHVIMIFQPQAVADTIMKALQTLA
jgi:hypothetical protein